MEVTKLAQQLLFNTVALEIHDKTDKLIGTGTSFIMSHQVDGENEELFLVTNKHVIKGGYYAYFYLTETVGDKPNIGKPFFIKTDFIEGQFYGHPNSDIDIAVFPLSWQLDLVGKSGLKAYLMKISTQIIASPQEITEMDVAREVIFVGYPNGLFDRKNYTPIVRSGTIATPVQLDFSGRPVFLIDASVFPGSSGSPVFSFEKTWGGSIAEVRLLGIIAEVFTQEDRGSFRLIPAPTQVVPIIDYHHMIDLGVVFKAHLIIETIDGWRKQYKKKT